MQKILHVSDNPEHFSSIGSALHKFLLITQHLLFMKLHRAFTMKN